MFSSTVVRERIERDCSSPTIYAREGLMPSDAIRELRRVRPIALSADGWESFSYQRLGEFGFVK